MASPSMGRSREMTRLRRLQRFGVLEEGVAVKVERDLLGKNRT